MDSAGSDAVLGRIKVHSTGQGMVWLGNTQG